MNEIQKLLEKRFSAYDGFIFFARDINDEQRIRDYIREYGPFRAQAMVNHEHLHFYVEASEEQERLASELERTWSERLKLELPGIRAKVMATNEGGAWVVSVSNA